MRNLGLLSAAALALAVAACTTTQDVETSLQSDWIGHQADDFYVAYGPPQSQYKLDNGSQIERWSSGVRTVVIPGSSNSYGTVSPGGFVNITTNTTPATAIGLNCTLDFVVSPKGQITEVRVAQDTIGLWRFSRCAEYLMITKKTG
jgi:hypothetical protein